MYNIYKITNKINKYAYIGVTSKDIHQRLQQHIKDSKKQRNKNKLLYIDMLEYGHSVFNIELIETVNTYNQGCNREIYWINYLDTFENGYNMTIGGKGRKTICDTRVIDLYKKLKNQKAVAQKLNIHPDTVGLILSNHNIYKIDSHEVLANTYSKPVRQFDLSGNIINEFKSTMDVERQTGFGSYSVSRACKGLRHTAYGYKWEFIKTT